MARDLPQVFSDNPVTSFESGDVFYGVRLVGSTWTNFGTTYADLLAAFGGGSVVWADITGTPTTLAGYGITDAQPLDSDLTAIAALTTTAFGRGLLTETNASTVRTTLGIDTNDAVTFGALTATSLVLTGTLTGATSINGLGISASGSTLSVYPGTTLALATFSLTLTTTAATNATFPEGTITLADTTTAQSLSAKTLTSPVLVTPALGVATATSVAIGGATIGSHALAATGTVSASGSVFGSNFIAINGVLECIGSGGTTNVNVDIRGGPGGSLYATADWFLRWNSQNGGATNIFGSGSADTSISRPSAGLLAIGTGTAGSVAGGISLTTLLIAQRTPASAGAAGTANTICFDADYIYVCTATNTWKRAAIATW